GRTTMNPPPPMLPALGWVTASANAVATAASTALPPFLRIAAPTSDAGADVVITIPSRDTTGDKSACCDRAGAANESAMHWMAAQIRRGRAGRSMMTSGESAMRPIFEPIFEWNNLLRAVVPAQALDAHIPYIHVAAPHCRKTHGAAMLGATA